MGVWKQSSRDGGCDRGRYSHREQISSHDHERRVDRGRDRERETKRRHREQDEEEREIKRRHREQDDDEGEKKQEKEEERMRLKRKERASRWEQLDVDVGKGDASLTGQITETAIPAASVLDAPTAAVLHQIPNLGCSLQAPVQLKSQSDQEVTRCLVLKNVSDPDPSLKEGSKYYKRIRDDIHQICGQHGAVHHVHADGKYGFVYLKFDSVGSATRAQKAFNGKSYKERVVTAHFMETRKYDAMFATWKR